MLVAQAVGGLEADGISSLNLAHGFAPAAYACHIVFPSEERQACHSQVREDLLSSAAVVILVGVADSQA